MKNKKMPYSKMKDKPETPKVGVGVILIHNRWGKTPIGEKYIKCREILLGLRKGSHGEGEWGLPGGHMEIGETFDDVCKREVKEETGIKINSVVKLGFTNDDFKEEGLHYITIFFRANWNDKQKPKLMEPKYCAEWKWFNFLNPPKNIGGSVKQILLEYRRLSQTNFI